MLQLIFPLFTAVRNAEQQALKERTQQNTKTAIYALMAVEYWKFIECLPLPRTLCCLFFIWQVQRARAQISEYRDPSGIGSSSLAELSHLAEMAVPKALLLDFVLLAIFFYC